MPLLQPRKQREREARQKRRHGRPVVQSVRSDVSNRDKLLVDPAFLRQLDMACKQDGISLRVESYTFLTSCLGTDLSAAVDVYSDWVDACDAVAKEAKHDLAGLGGARAGEEYGGTDLVARRQPGGAGRGGGDADEEDDDDGFIEHDEVDAEAEYAG